MTGDSVVKTLLILFAIAIAPFILALMVIIGYVWWGVVASHG
jgi:hypothetical protein